MHFRSNIIIQVAFKGLFFTLLFQLLLFTSCGEDEVLLNIPVDFITIKGDFIEDGGSSQLSAVISPENATIKDVTWKVSNEEVATINEDGVLTAVTNGILTVTASATDGSGVMATKSFNVSGVTGPQVMVESVTIQAVDITDGQPQQLIGIIVPSNATNKALIWSVSNEEVATINESGLLTPLENGTVVVSALAQDGSGVKVELSIAISGFVVELDGILVVSSSEILSALSNASPGDKIYIKGGNYKFNTTIAMNRDGQSDNVISLLADPNSSTRPVFDFSDMTENSSNRGVNLSGDYWHIKGIDFYGAGDNGMFVRGNYNFIEFCSFYENADTGLQIGNGGSDNTILNCDSYYNADSSLENADGFAAKLDCGSNNKFIGCRAWNNLDDGWDGYLRNTDNVSTYYENCWAIRNGYLKNGTIGAGDGNGFKTGGSDNKDLKHNVELRNCVAVGNVFDGFDHNSNRGSITIYNASAHTNGRNFSFGSSNIASSLIIKNSLSLASANSDQFNGTSTDITNNGWQNGRVTAADDFSSLDIDQMLGARQADGSLPKINYLHLSAGSDLIDAGVDVGLPFNGSAPDIGAFEFE